jgi:hypothetical protein
MDKGRLQRLAGLLKEEEDFDLSDNPMTPNNTIEETLDKFYKNHGLGFNVSTVYRVFYKTYGETGLEIVEEGWENLEEWKIEKIKFIESKLDQDPTLYDYNSLEIGGLFYQSFEEAWGNLNFLEKSAYAKKHKLVGKLAVSAGYTTELLYVKP